jgi:hypothetical protein
LTAAEALGATNSTILAAACIQRAAGKGGPSASSQLLSVELDLCPKLANQDHSWILMNTHSILNFRSLHGILPYVAQQRLMRRLTDQPSVYCWVRHALNDHRLALLRVLRVLRYNGNMLTRKLRGEYQCGILQGAQVLVCKLRAIMDTGNEG